MQLFNFIDAQLNKITMYRLLTYGLSLLIAASIVLSLVGMLPQPRPGHRRRPYCLTSQLLHKQLVISRATGRSS